MKHNEITIYWSFDGKYQIRAEEPVPIIQNYFKNKEAKDYEYIRCPSFQEQFHNTYGIKSIFDYNVKFQKNGITSDKHDQNFYDEFVNPRNVKSKLASFNMSYVFLADNNDLEMEYLQPTMEDNSFNNSAILIPGKINIGKYVRPLDCAFHARDTRVEIEENDIYAYVKFNTKKKIKFKRFFYTQELQDVMTGQRIAEYRKKTFKPLDWFYKKQQAIKVKERTVKLIKKNLV
jgi:hypothetical protein